MSTRVGAPRPEVAAWGHRADFAGLVAPVVVACSGGPDSVALLVLAHDAGLEPVVVHVDHGLRAGSADEADAVHAIAAGLGVPFVAERVRVDPGGNLEARARRARYDALENAREAAGATAVLVGHTADDQAETVLLNVLRGAAGSGLSGMAPRRGTIARPLLGMRRWETRAICDAHDLPVLDDPMNDDRAHRRVAVRHDVLPMLESVAGRDLVPVLARQADILREESAFLDALAEASWPGPGGPSAVALRGLPPVLARRALRRWLGSPPPSQGEIARALDVAAGVCRAAELAGGRVVRRSGGQLRVESG